MAKKNLRCWAEAKQQHAEQSMLARGRWVYFDNGAGIFFEDPYPPFGTYVAPTAWLPMVERPLFPNAIGELLHAALNPMPTPGPPYTHTIAAPPGWEYDDNGEPIRPLFWPDLTFEARTPAAYVPIDQVQPDGAGLHPLLLDHGIDRCLP